MARTIASPSPLPGLCRGVTTAVEAAEQVGQVRLRNATAVVRDDERYPSRFLLQRDLHRPAGRGELDRVVQEVAHRLPELPGLAA